MHSPELEQMRAQQVELQNALRNFVDPTARALGSLFRFLKHTPFVSPRSLALFRALSLSLSLSRSLSLSLSRSLHALSLDLSFASYPSPPLFLTLAVPPSLCLTMGACNTASCEAHNSHAV